MSAIGLETLLVVVQVVFGTNGENVQNYIYQLRGDDIIGNITGVKNNIDNPSSVLRMQDSSLQNAIDNAKLQQFGLENTSKPSRNQYLIVMAVLGRKN